MAPSIGDVVNTLAARFADAGLDTPRLDARIFVAHVLDTESTKLFVNSGDAFPEAKVAVLEQIALRRLAHEPVSRILGTREFWGLDFELGPATLDPRPDTETLVEAALRLGHPDTPTRVLDLGTGTGCILLAILSEWPKAHGVGVDFAEDALGVARRNAQRLGLQDRAVFQRGDWCEGLTGPFDVIVSNPPYITNAEMQGLAPEVADHDPALALRGGPDGLDAYRAIVPAAKRLLPPGGTVLLEVGHTQAEAVAGILSAHHYAPATFYRDLGGVVRVVAATMSTPDKALGA